MAATGIRTLRPARAKPGLANRRRDTESDTSALGTAEDNTQHNLLGCPMLGA
jgi:hypothetical protein